MLNLIRQNQHQWQRYSDQPLSSYPRAKLIAQTLKDWIIKGDFLLTEPVQLLPSADAGINSKPLLEKNGR
jgi:uncharacterized protein (DUF39 family)